MNHFPRWSGLGEIDQDLSKYFLDFFQFCILQQNHAFFFWYQLEKKGFLCVKKRVSKQINDLSRSYFNMIVAVMSSVK